MKVICLSNNDGFKVGNLKYFKKPFKSSEEIPVVEIDGDFKYILGICIKYSDEIWDLLNELGVKKSWKILSYCQAHF